MKLQNLEFETQGLELGIVAFSCLEGLGVEFKGSLSSKHPDRMLRIRAVNSKPKTAIILGKL